MRENSTLVKNPPPIKPLKTSLPTPTEATGSTRSAQQTNEFNTQSLWKKIFHTSNLAHTDELTLRTDSTSMSSSSQNKSFKAISFRPRGNRNMDDFNYTENLQKYGLDDSNTSDQNLSNVQGSYLSFLLLRHLRIRDLKRMVIEKQKRSSLNLLSEFFLNLNQFFFNLFRL